MHVALDRAVWLALLLACGSVAAGEPARYVLIDRSAQGVSGARGRVGFERLPREGESPLWSDPTGRWDSVGVSLLAGGGLLGAGVGDAHAQAQRNASIEPLRKATERAGMGALLERVVARALEARGAEAPKIQWAVNASPGYLTRLGLGHGAEALVMEKAATPLVLLSWDDRQPLLAVKLQSARIRSLVRGDVVSEGAQCDVRYVGLPAPEGVEPVGYWAHEGGKRFLEQLEFGMSSMLAVDCAAAAELPKVERDAVTELQVSGRGARFPGTLWKQADGVAFLRTRDGGITLVMTADVQPSAASSES